MTVEVQRKGSQSSVEGDKEGFLEEAMSQLRPDDKQEPARWRSAVEERMCPA